MNVHDGNPLRVVRGPDRTNNIPIPCHDEDPASIPGGDTSLFNLTICDLVLPHHVYPIFHGRIEIRLLFAAPFPTSIPVSHVELKSIPKGREPSYASGGGEVLVPQPRPPFSSEARKASRRALLKE